MLKAPHLHILIDQLPNQLLDQLDVIVNLRDIFHYIKKSRNMLIFLYDENNDIFPNL